MYSTCSLNPLEDEAVVAEFLANNRGNVEIIDLAEYYRVTHPGFKVSPGVKDW